MPKFFVVSDVHGFYDELIDALNKAGFDWNNPNHWVIGCGDFFDRGPDPYGVMRFFNGLPRKILVRGNHEDLFEECIDRGSPTSYDVSNGTYDTICELGGAGEGRSFDECCIVAETRTRSFFASMVNYFETENYIFVHGWIPVIVNDALPVYYRYNRDFDYDPEWRYTHSSAWKQARWLNGIDMSKHGLGEPGKTIVCGHWHCSYGYMLDSANAEEWISEFGGDAIWEPYYGNGVIAIDRCTVHTGKVNVLVLEDDFLEDNNESN